MLIIIINYHVIANLQQFAARSEAAQLATVCFSHRSSFHLLSCKIFLIIMIFPIILIILIIPFPSPLIKFSWLSWLFWLSPSDYPLNFSEYCDYPFSNSSHVRFSWLSWLSWFSRLFWLSWLSFFHRLLCKIFLVIIIVLIIPLNLSDYHDYPVPTSSYVRLSWLSCFHLLSCKIIM